MTAASPRKSSWVNGLFVTPYLVVYLALLLYPLIAGMWLSLHKADLFGGEVFVGLENFGRLLRDTVFLQAVRNTFYFVLLTVPPLAVIALGLAIALNRPPAPPPSSEACSSAHRCCR
jgi:multiple sugar transport system permease protein